VVRTFPQYFTTPRPSIYKWTNLLRQFQPLGWKIFRHNYIDIALWREVLLIAAEASAELSKPCHRNSWYLKSKSESAARKLGREERTEFPEGCFDWFDTKAQLIGL